MLLQCVQMIVSFFGRSRESRLGIVSGRRAQGFIVYVRILEVF